MVALKQLSLDGAKDPSVLRHMLRKEVEMMKKLRHPNIIRFLAPVSLPRRAYPWNVQIPRHVLLTEN